MAAALEDVSEALSSTSCTLSVPASIIICASEAEPVIIYVPPALIVTVLPLTLALSLSLVMLLSDSVILGDEAS